MPTDGLSQLFGASIFGVPACFIGGIIGFGIGIFGSVEAGIAITHAFPNEPIAAIFLALIAGAAITTTSTSVCAAASGTAGCCIGLSYFE